MKPLAKALGLLLEERDDLRERTLSADPVANHAAAMAASWTHPDRALLGGEPNIVAQGQGVAAVEALARRHAGRQIAVGTHATLLALILQCYDPSPPKCGPCARR
jgi:2,3-bisphosphoglycerate-dependent phosphoglycerate mutase